MCKRPLPAAVPGLSCGCVWLSLLFKRQREGRAGAIQRNKCRVEVAVVTCPKSFLVHPVYGVVGPVTGDELKL